ncbi:Octanoyltransferase LipM [Planctomycetes bacterium MalM25]|nr:Octanoyltransferase LipM [Planctomycetes bacterium MalM25]
MPIDCRLIVDDPAAGAWNMAIDEALLESAVAGGPATLRVYRWEPTLSLGYFQPYADRAKHPASAALPCVRRSSGGGALVHDQELTYSLTLSAADFGKLDLPYPLYCAAHRAVIAALVELGGDSERLTLCDPTKGAPPAEEPFLCFLRRADGDLLVGPPHPGAVHGRPVNGRYKVAGSAQRKSRGALLQHGGVLLERSPLAPELPGLGDLGLLAESASSFEEVLIRKFADGLNLRLSATELETNERERANRLLEQKHADGAWIRKR